MTCQKAIDLALAILQPFAESSLYEDYQTCDGFTDQDFGEMVQTLKAMRDKRPGLREEGRDATDR